MDGALVSPVIAQLLEAAQDDGVRVVSLDVFDTALTRRVAQPDHLFVQLEEAVRVRFGRAYAANLAGQRVQAERAARDAAWTASGAVEVTLAQIYGCLAGQCPQIGAAMLEAIMALELELETANAVVNPAVLGAFTTLRGRGQSVAFVSDTYFSREFVTSLLRQAGYDGWAALLVSSELLRTKASGTIWPVLEQELAVTPEQILHMGDNAQSDVAKPRERGIRTLHWTATSWVHKHGVALSPALLPLSALKAQVRDQRQAEQVRDQRPAEVSWDMLGRSYGVLAYGAFVRWVEQRAVAMDADHIFFLARDGHVLKRAHDILHDHGAARLPSTYLETARSPLIRSSITELTPSAIEFLASGRGKRSIAVLLERMGIPADAAAAAKVRRIYPGLEHMVQASIDPAMPALLAAFAPEILERSAALRQRLGVYLEQIGYLSCRRPLVVDIGWNGNLQRALRTSLRLLGRPEGVIGLYLGLFDRAHAARAAGGWMEAMAYSDFAPTPEQIATQSAVGVLEQIHSAPHGSVVDYCLEDGRAVAVYRDNAVESAQYETCLRPMQDAAMETLRAIAAGRGPVALDALTPAAARAAIDNLCLSPSPDEVALIGRLVHFDGFEHAGAGEPLVPELPPIADEAALRDALGHSYWRAGTLNRLYQETSGPLREALHRQAGIYCPGWRVAL